jgi:4-amino-4-deoxy-L-arabinose transferase-like glycosyltransferase
LQPANNTALTLDITTRRLLWLVLAAMLIGRVTAMIVMPLTDTSEARYGEIARKMVETGDWITPQIQYGVPFWAKPPLSTWLSAIDIKLFGASEFSVRLPSLLVSLAILLLVWRWIARCRGRDQALLTTAMLATTVLFAAAAGAVMTDASLAFCTTLTMISFWNALQKNVGCHGSHRWLWGYGFFVGLGLGLLAKGPLVGVLTFLPIVTWLFARREWRRAWRKLPWISGSVLMLIIALPWYLLAEHRTPGFLQYFIVGEHIHRFLNPGWSGDKYGNAHAAPIGMIWIFWLYAAAPFSLLAVVWIARRRREILRLFSDRTRRFAGDGWSAYLLLWSVMHLCFFTAAGNVIWTYALTGLPAFACLAIELQRGELLQRRLPPHGQQNSGLLGIPWRARGFIAACCLMPLASLCLTALYLQGSASVKSSQRELIRAWIEQRPTADSQLVYFLENYPSAAFYSQGKATTTRKNSELEALLDNGTSDFIAVKDRDLAWVSATVRRNFRTVQHFDDIALMQEIPVAAPTASPQ